MCGEDITALYPNSFLLVPLQVMESKNSMQLSEKRVSYSSHSADMIIVPNAFCAYNLKIWNLNRSLSGEYILATTLC